MNKIIEYLESRRLHDHIIYNALQHIRYRPDNIEEVVIGIIEYYKENNDVLKEQLLKHMERCVGLPITKE